jgi:DNA-directed RNA polymerase specialized sigma24 family protein
VSDEEVFRELYPSLRRLAAVMTPSSVDPDDIVQEALSRALKVRGLAENTNPEAYLRRCIAHIAFNETRGPVVPNDC